TEVAIDTGLTRDLYVALGESLGQDNWAMRIYIKPFVSWIWGGCALMVLGGLLAVCDRRYRLRRRSTSSRIAPNTALANPSLAMPPTEEPR
ncbi:cytochrome c-type biogenesis CcmF C-terminal domain-containing protein, partial [Burkholderia cenocepacia]|uniref:cytochrome c-type biogenesis CcmF C-terminal domain-containing protein n=1 Tax=Burkholderia cenocepacia TaxID=95486 RepID=UPI00406D4906